MDYIFGSHATRPELPPFIWNPDQQTSINPHMLICGGSGAGKTTLLLQIVNYLESQRKHIFIFDLKGDMKVKNSNGETIGNYIEFTAWDSEYGINPFEFDTGVPTEELETLLESKATPTDEQLYKIKNSGPKVQVLRIIEIIKKNFLPNMGTAQRDVLYFLLMDTYKMNGFEYNNIYSWSNELPSLDDTLKLIERIKVFVEDSAKQDDDETAEVGIYSELSKNLVKDINKSIKKSISPLVLDNKDISEEEILKSLDIQSISEIVNKYALSNRKYLNDMEDNISTWFDEQNIDAEKYLPKDVYKTVIKLSSYINALVESGVFNSNKPPVKPGLNVINISGLDVEIQRFIVDVWLGKVFKACKIRGTYTERPNRTRGDKVDTYVIIDESKLIAGTSKDKNDPYSYLNRVATEARGFGLGLIVAAQSAEHFPPEFLKNFNAQVILNTSIADMDAVRKSFGIDKELLKFTQNGWGNALVKSGKSFNKVKSDFSK